MSIPAGYQLVTSSWENDGDHYRDIIISGLSEAEVLFWLDLGKKFRSQNIHINPGLGNGENDAEDIVEAVDSSLKKFPMPEIQDLLREQDEYDPEHGDPEEQVAMKASIYYELIVDKLVGYTEEYDGEQYFVRVVDTQIVYFYEKEVPDVTQELQKKL